MEIRVGGQENDSWQCSCIARFRSALDCDWNIFVSRATSPRQAAKAAKSCDAKRLISGADDAPREPATGVVKNAATASSTLLASKRTFLTRIHGEVYDLTGFDHPGGPAAIALCLGRDGTALFEAHHPFTNRSKLDAVLAKYRCTDQQAVAAAKVKFWSDDTASPYQWPPAVPADPFEKDVKAAVRKYFESEAKRRGISLQQATKATPRRWLELLFFAVAFCYSAHAAVQGRWWALCGAPVSAWVWLTNMFHDGCHFALSTDWRVNAALPYLTPWLSSPLAWYHQHVIGHHAYPNVEHKDPDLAHAPQLMREHSSVRWRPTHRAQSTFGRILLVWGIAVSVGLQLLSDVRLVVKGSYNNVVPADPNLTRGRLTIHLLGRMTYFFTTFVWPWLLLPSWPEALLFTVVPPLVFSLLFMCCSQVNHLTEETAHAQSTNYYRHQVVTAQDFSVKPPPAGTASDRLAMLSNWVWRSATFYITGGLNHQIEHHLFPTVNHCHLPHLQAIVEHICIKHGVRYHAAESWCAAMRAHLKHTQAMGAEPVACEPNGIRCRAKMN